MMPTITPASGPLSVATTVEMAAALSDPGRVRALLALRERELCVCHLVELLGLSTSTVSRHMSQLRRAGLVGSRRDGRWVWYRRVDREVDGGTSAAPSLLAWLDAALGDGEQARADRARIDSITCRIPGPCDD